MKRKYEVMLREPYWDVGYGPIKEIQVIGINCTEFTTVAQCWNKKRAEQIAKLLNEADEPEEAAVPVNASLGSIITEDGKFWYEQRTEGKSEAPSESSSGDG